MKNKTVGQARFSRLPIVLGACASDIGKLLTYINEAQERLIYAGGEDGWWGTWWRVAFTVNSDVNGGAYLTLPRSLARLVNVSVCKTPVRIQNEFYEFLEASIGPQPSCPGMVGCNTLEIYDRGTYPTFVDLTAGMSLRVYRTDSRDDGKRLLISGTDTNDRVIRNTDGVNGAEAQGEFLTLAAPFTDSVANFNTLTGIQKDVTYGDVLLYGVDPATSEETLLSLIEADEETLSYRRYYIGGLPSSCATQAFQVEGLAKLEFIPARNDTDYLVISNIPALKAECEAIRYEEMDNPTALKMAEAKHLKAIRLLNQQLTHYLGRQRPAVIMNLHNQAPLRNRKIGTLI